MPRRAYGGTMVFAPGTNESEKATIRSAMGVWSARQPRYKSTYDLMAAPNPVTKDELERVWAAKMAAATERKLRATGKKRPRKPKLL